MVNIHYDLICSVTVWNTDSFKLPIPHKAAVQVMWKTERPQLFFYLFLWLIFPFFFSHLDRYQSVPACFHVSRRVQWMPSISYAIKPKVMVAERLSLKKKKKVVWRAATFRIRGKDLPPQENGHSCVLRCEKDASCWSGRCECSSGSKCQLNTLSSVDVLCLWICLSTLVWTK